MRCHGHHGSVAPWPTWSHRSRRQRNQVISRVRATIKDLDASGETIDAAIAAGATNLDRLQFRATDPSAPLAKAREEAVAAAALTASQLASASGVEVTGVLSIVEGGGDLDALRLRDSAAGSSAQRQSASTPIQPGTIDIAVTVFVEYLIS